MKTVRYLGTAPGQPGCVRISGDVYRRGHQYNVTNQRAAQLVRNGGFVVITNERAANSLRRRSKEASSYGNR